MKNELVKSILNTKDVPSIKLVENEHIELVIKRSPIYLVFMWAGEILFGMFFLAILIFSYSIDLDSYFNLTNGLAKLFITFIILTIYGVIFLAGVISTKVYTSNKLYITNKRVIQNVKTSLFAGSTNVIDLISVEDVSFKKSGIFEYLFKIGTLRMSTVGDETTYVFRYVDTPTDELEKITHLVHTEKEKQKEIPDTHIIKNINCKLDQLANSSTNEGTTTTGPSVTPPTVSSSTEPTSTISASATPTGAHVDSAPLISTPVESARANSVSASPDSTTQINPTSTSISSSPTQDSADPNRTVYVDLRSSSDTYNLPPDLG